MVAQILEIIDELISAEEDTASKEREVEVSRNSRYENDISRFDAAISSLTTSIAGMQSDVNTLEQKITNMSNDLRET